MFYTTHSVRMTPYFNAIANTHICLITLCQNDCFENRSVTPSLCKTSLTYKHKLATNMLHDL